MGSRRRSIIIFTLLFSIIIGFPCEVDAQLFKRKKKKETQVDSLQKKNDYEKFFEDNKEMETLEGLIRLHKTKDKLYFELQDSLLGKEMLLGSTISEISDNGHAIIGSKPNDPIHFTFSKVDNSICINIINSDNIYDPKNEGLARAIEKSNINPIFHSFKIKTYNADSTAFVFDVTDLFVSDNKHLSPFDPYSAYTSMGYKKSEMYQSDKSFIGDVKTFSDNVVVKSTLSYTYSLSGSKGTTLIEDEPFTALMTRSIVLLPETPYRPRITDSRIAIFPTAKQLYDPIKQRTRIITYSNRWRLEPSDMDAFNRGELVEPIKPITFYIDNNFPEKWRPYIKEGVAQWAEVFEEIGFKNAIEALDYPEDDPEFDPDNIKFSCLRYAPISIQNAMGPSWVDPRSGEIINASVYVYHDVVKLLNNWILIQTAAADKRVRTMNIPEEVIGDAFRYVISHEIGHCLGFMHNMSASANIPVDSLRSPSFTQQYGTTTSIMDYARFNYVAQPGDFEKGVKLTPPRFGVYDRFLVKWNYTPLPEASTSEEEYKITSKWLNEASANPLLRWGKQQGEVIDPRSQSEDLGDNSVKASEYGIKNLKYILSNITEWIKNEDDDYTYLKTIYDGIVMQYYMYVNHVYANVGGIYLWEKHVGDHVQHYTSTPYNIQKEALHFLLNQMTDLDWLNNEEVFKNLTLIGSPADVIRSIMMKAIIDSPAKVELSALKATEKAYSVTECLDDVYNFVWRPTINGKALNDTQIKMQRLFLKEIGNGAAIKIEVGRTSLADNQYSNDLLQKFKSSTNANSCSFGNTTEAISLGNSPISGYGDPLINYNAPQLFDAQYYGYILKVRNLLLNNQNHYDKETRLHYQLLLHNLDKALNN